MAAITHVVYDPPVTSLPYLAVIFLADGTPVTTAFKTELKANAYLARMARQAKVARAEK